MSSVGFDELKGAIIRNLKEGIDLSPKGCIDAPIADLVHCLNSLPDYCTTSSCSGRISCYRMLEERKGIDWILVRHGMIDAPTVKSCIANAYSNETSTESNEQLTMLKCEGALLHVLVRDVEAARVLHSIAMATGFRECGISIGPKKVILAIRTTAFGLELPIAAGKEVLFSDRALDLTVREANKRLRCNFSRLDRLLTAIKDHFKWPVLKEVPFKGTALAMDVIDRWGHVVVPSAAGRIALLGGFGIAAARSNRRTTSSFVDVSQTGDSFEFNTSNSDSICTDPIDLMHSAAATDGDVIVVVGGRTSPKCPLDTVLFLDKDTLQPLPNHMFTTGFESPSPRWGHSFTYIGHSCFLLIGGRDCDKVLHEAFILRKIGATIGTSDIFWQWEQVLLPEPMTYPNHFGRFFHASCILDLDITGHNHRLFPEAARGLSIESEEGTVIFSRVLLHGGLLSLDDSSTDSSFFAVTITLLSNEVSGEISFQGSIDKVATPALKSDETSETTITAGDDSVMKFNYSRFGHCLTNIKAKTLIMSGGASYASDTYNSILNEAANLKLVTAKVSNSTTAMLPVDEQALIAFDWLSREDGKIFLVNRRVELLSHQRSSPFADEEAIRCDAFAMCRSHHQSIVVKALSIDLLVAIGGGTLCVGFSPHYCSPLAFELSWGRSSSYRGDIVSCFDERTAAGRPSAVKLILSPSDASTDIQVSSSWSILVPKLAVKQIKVILEKAGAIDKSKRISAYQGQSSNATISAFSRTGAFVKIDDAVEVALMDSMAIPIKEEMAIACSARDGTKYNSEILLILNILENFLPRRYQDTFFLCRQQNRPAKLDIVSSHKRAEDLLVAICTRHKIDSSEIPKKFEFVGDILMIQEECLVSEKWTTDFENAHHFWSTVASWFGLHRVARKARVDPGPKRESHVELLYVSPDYQSSKKASRRRLCRNEMSDGWVIVTENNIRFGFDICKVMFCSGNNTERMRMARVAVKDQIVVDLYSGIGYYSMPFLVHAKAAVVHAFEWNINSVASLIVNLATAGVESHRCVLHYGDNNMAVFGVRSADSPAALQKPPPLPIDNYNGYLLRDVVNESQHELDKWACALSDIADRVCLGLLPSSRGGWEAAARVLSRKGGVLHVHYNVSAVDIEKWTTDMLETFREIFKIAGKEMSLECVNVEKVKSYAPRVFHIVADVVCTPVV